MSASLAFQKVARALLTADSDLVSLVPADNIVDANARPEVYPKIVLGQDQELPADGTVFGRYTNLFADIHIWVEEPGLAGAKTIAGVIRRVLRDRLWEQDGYRGIDTRFGSARFIRDPDGEHSHGIVTIEVTSGEE
jgi:hypothetical protein